MTGGGDPEIEGRIEALIPGVLERRPRALARAISLLERGGEGQRRLVQRLHEESLAGSSELPSHPEVPQRRVVGITGAPGAGKSTLVDRLARACRERGETVGILAVDPSSPFTGGALLGDRIRMQSLYTDSGVFIRSMATRGSLGGLARATHDAADVLAAAGFDWILLETVGVGQDEVDVVESADTVVVVTVPGMGDDVQAIKAGLMEIADVFVINKADREGVRALRRDLETMLGLARTPGLRQAAGDGEPWRPPILETVASRGEGIEEVLGAIREHRRWLAESGSLERRRRGQMALRVRTVLTDWMLDAAREAGLEEAVERGAAEGRDPYRVAEELFGALFATAAGRPSRATEASGDADSDGGEP